MNGPRTQQDETDPYRFVGILLVMLVATDLALIAINFLGAPSFLSLDEEKNFPTWYSSVKLFGTALAALWCWSLEPAAERRGRGRFVWPTLAAVFVALSMDETATAHERLATFIMSWSGTDSLRDRLLGGDSAKDAFAWPVLFAPIILVILYFLVASLYDRMKGNRRSMLLGMAGCVVAAASISLEGAAIYTSPPLDAWGEAEIARYQLFAVFEESGEVATATLIFSSLLLHARYLMSRAPVDR